MLQVKNPHLLLMLVLPLPRADKAGFHHLYYLVTPPKHTVPIACRFHQPVHIFCQWHRLGRHYLLSSLPPRSMLLPGQRRVGLRRLHSTPHTISVVDRIIYHQQYDTQVPTTSRMVFASVVITPLIVLIPAYLPPSLSSRRPSQAVGQEEHDHRRTTPHPTLNLSKYPIGQ